VKKWFRDKDSGFLDNKGGHDIVVRKADLVDCQFLKVGVTVQFECHTENQMLVPRKGRLSNQKHSDGQNNRNHAQKPIRFGVMT